MPTPADLVKDHREHYLRRKLARSPLLQFTPGAYRIDICALFDGITANVPAVNEAGVTTPEALIKALIGPRGQATLHNVRQATLQKLKRLRLNADETRHSTGQHALYLGYPCVVIPDDAGKVKFAPVFLFALELGISNTRVTIKRRGDASTTEDAGSGSDDAVFNRLLAAFIKWKSQVRLASDETRYAIDPGSFAETVEQIFAPWPHVACQWRYPGVSPFPGKDALKQLSADSNDACIVDHAVLGLADFAGQALLDDLDRIEAMLRDGTQCSAPLKKLLERRSFGGEAAPDLPRSDIQKWLVEKSDPSQEAVVWAQRNAPVVVLQGPPGTGKSQTIVNTIADALAANESVLVVCQKRAATEVVRKRLDGVGLGDLCVLIDDLDKDRSTTLKRIREIDTEFSSSIWHASERKRLSEELAKFESNIDSGIDALQDNDGGIAMRYRDIQAALSRIEHLDAHPDWSQALGSAIERVLAPGLNKSRVAQLLSRIREIDSRANALRYTKNVWSSVSPQLADDSLELDALQSSMRTAVDIGQRIESGALRVRHSDASRWVAEHPWFTQPNVRESGLPHFSDSEGAASDTREFNRWLTAIRHLAQWNQAVSPETEATEARQGKFTSARLSEVSADGGELSNIATLRAELHRDDLLRAVDAILSEHAAEWEHHVHGLILHAWKRSLLQRRGRDFQLARQIPFLCGQLSQRIVEKRKADTQDILSRFDKRVAARDWLQENDLLRLRGRGTIPKTTLRRLHARGGARLKQLQPALLTSPETASALLPLTPGLYDLVVIDEASQMFVAEAIPMLFRANRALIAGDRQQMPPSDFFAFSSDDADGADGETYDDDLAPDGVAPAEGIYRLLDAADESLGAKSPHRQQLEVHYRSARKELIDFSNHAFYDGKLIIPSGNAALPSFMTSAIVFEQLEGAFNKGLNEIEAQQIVMWLARIWELPLHERPSVGVIVNNIKQKARIEDVLADRAEKDARFANSYAQESERQVDGEDISFFVRSVESVQGDERDVIIFGATYAGSSRAFGPLTKPEDGRKRLNVAVTRAKRGMIVLCSLNVAHISNEAEIATHERYYVYQYLRYARAVSEHDFAMVGTILNQLNPERDPGRNASAMTESPFEDEIKAYVTSLGYFVQPQVGESGFRIDLGVRRAAHDLNFLCGLECDGAQYHSGWTARTRDVWRQEILESKGWAIIRIWSTDWFDKPEESQRLLAHKLQRLLDGFSALHPIVSPANAPASHEAEKQVENSEISAPPPQREASNVIVEIGDTVDYVGDDKRTRCVKIVRGVGDSNVGTVNALTPLAKALLGAAEGDDVEFSAPTGTTQLRIRLVQKSP